MTPFQGAGAGQAVEVIHNLYVPLFELMFIRQDAFVLAHLLGHRRASRENMTRVLQIFSQVRQPTVERIADLSRRNGFLFAMHGTPTSLPELVNHIQQNFDEAQDGDPIADMRRAIEVLEAS
jgi:hypothetical protein